MDIMRFLYGIKNVYPEECDLVVALGYGLNIDSTLPPATEMTLRHAVEFSREFNAPLAWSSSNYFFRGSEIVENQKKMDLAKKYGIPESQVVVGKGISNSVTEAKEIKAALAERGIYPSRILVVGDWAHARSALIIWKKVFPDAKITFFGLETLWNQKHRASLQKSYLKWLIACFMRHGALRVLGIDWVAKKQHPIGPGE